MAPGIYGIDMIAEARSGNEPCILTSNYQEFLTLYGDAPIAYVHGIPGMNDIQQLRQASQMFTSDSDGLTIARTVRNPVTLPDYLPFSVPGSPISP